jgi:hypothetical protein
VTIDEFNSHHYLRLHLTSETLTWDPTTDLNELQEHAMMDYFSNIVCGAAARGPTLGGKSGAGGGRTVCSLFGGGSHLLSRLMVLEDGKVVKATGVWS